MEFVWLTITAGKSNMHGIWYVPTTNDFPLRSFNRTHSIWFALCKATSHTAPLAFFLLLENLSFTDFGIMRETIPVG